MANNSEANMTCDTDVIIVGAGPTGLMAAALLTRCGIRVRIFDKNEKAAQESRAFGVHAKTIELFLNIGLEKELLKDGMIAAGMEIYVKGRRTGQLNFDDIGRHDTPYSFLLMVPQWEIEKILAEDLKKQGIEVERATEVIEFKQDDNRVLTTIKKSDESIFELSSSYIIGADGAHSTVRKTLGLKYDGAPYEQGFLLADCRIDWPFDYQHMKIFLGRSSFVLYLPLRGKNFSRIVVSKSPAEPTSEKTKQSAGSEPVSLKEIEATLADACGQHVNLSDPVWTTRYRIHHRIAEHYSSGRAFLAGDAAHIHSPAGGQGMNTGLQDAANLAWKLALVIQGRNPALLDTYHEERWPVGNKILKFSDRLFGVMASPHKGVTMMRNLIVPIVSSLLSKSHAIRAKAFHFVSQLGIRYHSNKYIFDSISVPSPKRWRQSLAAGRRAPDGEIARHLNVFDLIRGYQFHLLVLSKKALTSEEITKLVDEVRIIPEAIGLPVKTHIIANSLLGQDERIIRAESNIVFANYKLGQSIEQALFLIRPDGYIAYRSDHLDFEKLRLFLSKI